MVNRLLITLGILSLLLIILLNVVPIFWQGNFSKYIEQDQVEGMALLEGGLPYTLNFDQQKRSIDILNRAIPVTDFKALPGDPPVNFSSLQIFRFDQEPIMIEPITWMNENLVFRSPLWSDGPLMEVSRRELYEILENAYDKDLPQTAHH